MDLKKQRIEMAVTGLMLGLASYLQYIAYHTKARTNGYSYQFQYALPYDRIQNEIPEDAISILSTMVIHETPIPDQLGMENRHAH